LANFVPLLAINPDTAHNLRLRFPAVLRKKASEVAAWFDGLSVYSGIPYAVIPRLQTERLWVCDLSVQAHPSDATDQSRLGISLLKEAPVELLTHAEQEFGKVAGNHGAARADDG
jgi:hypothetical protein